MFNSDLKEKAINRLKSSAETFNNTLEIVKSEAEALYKLRVVASEELIVSVEKYVNQLANTPKDFDKSFSAIVQSYRNFNQYVEDLKSSDSAADVKIGSAAGAGTIAAVGVATLGPTAAIAIATTFGTASTGTAIAALSGAAASNAALAWLGGGTLAAGAGGVAAGKALLALAGPIGWGIGALVLAGGGYLFHKKNAQIAIQADAQRINIEGYSRERYETSLEIRKISTLTKSEITGIESLLANLNHYAVKDYSHFDGEHKDHLIALINHTRVLGMLLNKSPKDKL